MSKPTRVEYLLSELCSHFGFCGACREPAKFESFVGHGASAFTDAVFQAEGMDPSSEKQLRRRVREYVAKRFADFADASDA